MTFAVLVIFGFGVILITSALDGTPVILTFIKIISGQPLNLTGGIQAGTTAGGGNATSPTAPVLPPTAPPRSPPVAPSKPGPQQ